MAGYRLISSDSHVAEPPDLWTNRIEPNSGTAPHTLSTQKKMATIGGSATTKG